MQIGKESERLTRLAGLMALYPVLLLVAGYSTSIGSSAGADRPSTSSSDGKATDAGASAGRTSSTSHPLTEVLTAPSGGTKPHIVMLLFDDYGWANAGWHRNYTAPGGDFVPPTDEARTSPQPRSGKTHRHMVPFQLEFESQFCIMCGKSGGSALSLVDYVHIDARSSGVSIICIFLFAT